MRNNTIRNILIAAIISPIFLLCGCSEDDPDRVYNERNAFITYLTAEEYTDTDYEELDGGVFRVITGNVLDDEGDTTTERTEIENGDNVSLYFASYTFSVSSKKIDAIIYTNEEDIIKLLIAKEEGYAGPYLNPEYWPTDPLEVTVGKREILKGIDIALAGCKKGDRVILLVPSDLAYGNTNTGYLPEETPIYLDLRISDVIKINTTP